MPAAGAAFHLLGCATMNAPPDPQAWILMIGSLLWDRDQGRPEWRGERLDKSRKVRIRTPIRYGRKSTGDARKNQYTMTFSHEAAAGRGYAVPCKDNISTFEDLIEEAGRLARAEGLSKSTKRWERFGAVGILFRDPQGPLSTDLR